MAQAGVVLGLLAGCSSGDSTPGPAGCAHPVGSACAGVPTEPVCGQDVCADGVSCASVVTAHDDGSLTSAIMAAKAGSCIALAPGTYAPVALPGGVSLLGRGAEFVTIGGLRLAAGTGATVRGLTVGAGGVELDSAVVHLDSVRIAGSGASGITTTGPAALTVARSEITGSALYGVQSSDAASVALEASVIASSKGPGLWMTCAGGCTCAKPPTATLTDVVVSDNALIGAAFGGVTATLSNVVVQGTGPLNLEGGGGIAAMTCANVTATSLSVAENRGYGILIDDSAATLGGSDPTSVSIRGNHLGVWVQNLAADGSQSVKLQGAVLEENIGVAIGSSGVINGFVIYGTQIRKTASDVLNVEGGGQESVGDGILWGQGAAIQMSGVALAANARQSILINGAVGQGSTIQNVTLSDGDETTGILEQNFDGSGIAPTLGPGAPTITQKATQVLAIPVAPAAPAGI